MLHEKPDKNIVEDNTNQHQQKITEELHASMQNGAWKNHVAHEHKSGGKADQEGNKKGGNMGLKRYKAKMQNLFV